MEKILPYLESKSLVSVCKVCLNKIPYDENWLSISRFIREGRVGDRQTLSGNLREINTENLGGQELILPKNSQIDTLKFLEYPTFKLLNSSRCFQHTEGDGKLRGVNLKDKILVYKLTHSKYISRDVRDSLGCEDIIIEWNPQVDFTGFSLLMRCETLKSVSFVGVEKILTVSDNFLYLTGGLERISFERFTSVEKILDNFMSLSGIKSVSFKGFRRVKRIAHNFMNSCQHLEQISFHGLNSLWSVEHNFLRLLPSLKSISFEGLESLEFIGSSFLSHNPNLERVSLNGLRGVKAVGDEFLFKCPKLHTLEFKGIKSVAPFRSKIEKLPPNIILDSEVKLDDDYFLLLGRLNSQEHTITLPYKVYKRIPERYLHLRFQIEYTLLDRISSLPRGISEIPPSEATSFCLAPNLLCLTF